MRAENVALWKEAGEADAAGVDATDKGWMSSRLWHSGRIRHRSSLFCRALVLLFLWIVAIIPVLVCRAMRPCTQFRWEAAGSWRPVLVGTGSPLIVTERQMQVMPRVMAKPGCNQVAFPVAFHFHYLVWYYHGERNGQHSGWLLARERMDNLALGSVFIVMSERVF